MDALYLLVVIVMQAGFTEKCPRLENSYSLEHKCKWNFSFQMVRISG